jgi:NADH:ubiquinone oxidoreductase subunit 5 (subunit L)/multisubunit Na+/H+ antiporter MnhA subunit
LLVARFSAIKESDSKKVVALSTLRQLGLMFFALTLGGMLVCLIHIIMHAFAKANLFLNIGSILHLRFSQQDSRSISSGDEESNLFISTFIRVLRLAGVAFFAGFFSKEYILIGELIFVLGVFFLILLISVVSLTVSYCLLFLSLISKTTCFYSLTSISKRKFFSSPIVLMSLVTIFAGFFYRLNIFFVCLVLSGLSGFYWVALGFGGVLYSFKFSVRWLVLFVLQKDFLRVMSKSFVIIKKLNHFFSSLLEPFHLVLSLTFRALSLAQVTRAILLRSFIIFIIVLF